MPRPEISVDAPGVPEAQRWVASGPRHARLILNRFPPIAAFADRVPPSRIVVPIDLPPIAQHSLSFSMQPRHLGDMRRSFRLFRRALAWAGFIVLFVAAMVTGVLWLTLPPRSQQARIAGLSGSVDIGFDADGIPRIRAASATDAAAALGFVHARDRLFQMDLMRRAASGRLSEIAGPATLPHRPMMRTLGLRRHAVEDTWRLPADARAMLEAYARGVNAWIAERGRFSAPEFLFLGTPEPWQPVDSLLWGETMGLWLSLNWRTELSRQALAGPRAAADGRRAVAAGGRRRPARGSTGTRLDAKFAGAAGRPACRAFPDPSRCRSTASNEWAVDGRHTATGAPLLAGDPHLAFGFPGIWYLARIETPAGVLAGATAPGVPFLVLGHNGHIAWTFTTTGADVQDVFIETSAGDGQYQTPDGPRPFVVREERIKVRGEPDQMLTVRETRHGPVVSDLRRPGRPDPGRGDGQSGAGQYRGGRPARAEPGARRRGCRARPPR